MNKTLLRRLADLADHLQPPSEEPRKVIQVVYVSPDGTKELGYRITFPRLPAVPDKRRRPRWIR